MVYGEIWGDCLVRMAGLATPQGAIRSPWSPQSCDWRALARLATAIENTIQPISVRRKKKNLCELLFWRIAPASNGVQGWALSAVAEAAACGAHFIRFNVLRASSPSEIVNF